MTVIANNLSISPVFSILSKGESGTGKSIASCGKEFRPVYCFDLENRMRSVVNYYRKLDGHIKDLEYDTFTMHGGFHPLDKKMDDLVRSCPYKTIVVATLSSYVDIVLSHTISNKEKDGGKKFVAGIQVNVLEDFSAEDAAIIFELIKFLKMQQSQGVNIILEAHVTPYETTDRKTQETKISRPIVTKGKKAPARIPGYFDETWHFYTNVDSTGVAYMMTTQPTSIDYAKTSNNLRPFYDFTNKDLSEEIMKDITDEVRGNPRKDPNAPKIVSFG